MKDKVLNSLIDKYLIETITPDEEKQLSQLLHENPQNKVYFEQLVGIWLSSHPTFNPKLIDVEVAKATVLNKIKPAKSRNKQLLVWVQRVAAILLLPLGIYLVYQFKLNTNASTITYYQVVSPAGTTLKVTLPDSSEVWMNAGSKIEYCKPFVVGKRLVKLEGEAYFHVSSDKQNPFVVRTVDLDVIATGTQFNVETYRADSLVSVTLIEGKVDVNLIKTSKTSKLIHGKRLIFNNLNNNVQVLDANIASGAWRDGSLMFENERLDIILKRIGYLYNIDFEIENQQVASQHYKASFNKKSLNEILNSLKLTAPIHFKIVKNNNTKTKIEVY
jgi:ferric-dicitrate binding protein FerR (iron transport regulator)